MISLKNGVHIRLRIPPSILNSESKLLYRSIPQSSWRDDDYNFIKKWINHRWYSKHGKLSSNKYKTLEKDIYLNSNEFKRICGTNINSGKISELFVKETFERKGFLYESSPKFVYNYNLDKKEKLNNIVPDGLIKYGNDKQLLIEVKSLTEQKGTASEKLYGILFKYTSILEKLREKGIKINLLVVLCARQQDEKHGKILINAFKDKCESDFLDITIKYAKLSGILGFISVRELNMWISTFLLSD